MNQPLEDAGDNLEVIRKRFKIKQYIRLLLIILLMIFSFSFIDNCRSIIQTSDNDRNRQDE